KGRLAGPRKKDGVNGVHTANQVLIHKFLGTMKIPQKYKTISCQNVKQPIGFPKFINNLQGRKF
ncbi:MAG: hypothetical protein AAB347_10605, partial [Bacteroidota bacterium]